MGREETGRLVGGGDGGEWYKDLTRNGRDLPGLSREVWAPVGGLTQLIT